MPLAVGPFRSAGSRLRPLAPLLGCVDRCLMMEQPPPESNTAASPSTAMYGVLFAFPARAVVPPQSVKIWRRPSSSASSSSAIMYSMLGRARPSTHRLTV